MTSESLNNKKLPTRDINWTDDTFVYEICLRRPVREQLIFERTLLNEPEPGLQAAPGAKLVRPPKAQLLNVPVRQHCRIEFRLCSGVAWRWNEEMAIGRGNEDILHYFNLEYWDEAANRWVRQSEITSTDDRIFRRVRFCAEKRNGVMEDHPINLNVLLEYPDDKILPVTIDPDIQNPKT